MSALTTTGRVCGALLVRAPEHAYAVSDDDSEVTLLGLIIFIWLYTQASSAVRLSWQPCWVSATRNDGSYCNFRESGRMQLQFGKRCCP